MSKEAQSSYKQIMKATSIFGGVQVVNIFISIVRSKFIAVLLGPVGIGISGMLTATIGIIEGLTNFGLGTSAVRDISSAYESGNPTRIAIISKVLNRWVWVTGLFGMVITLVFSPWLSFVSFGNYDYTFAFMILSVTLLISQLNSGHQVVLQGSRKISFLAKANLLGSIIGLFITIPLYYIWGNNGIVPAIFISSFISLIISYYFKKRIQIQNVRVSRIRSFAEGKLMLKMGFLISMSSFMTLGFSYLVRLFISYEGNIAEVGLYNAGFTIISTYVGLIFSAMGTDYYPRLSSVSDNIEKVNPMINNQIEMGLIILGPVILTFILCIQWIILILYSELFLVITTMLVWAALGMLFKSVSWSIAFLFLAKGSSKLFFWNELFTNIYLTIFNLVGYHFWGLSGLGYSFVFSYLLYMLQVYVVTKHFFLFTLDKNVLVILLIQLAFSIASLIVFYLLVGTFYYYTAVILILANFSFSIYLLNNRMSLTSYFSKHLN